MDGRHDNVLNRARQTEILRLIKRGPDAYFSSVRRSDFGRPAPRGSHKSTSWSRAAAYPRAIGRPAASISDA